MTSRRRFLKASSLVALAPTVPGFLQQLARASRPAKDQSILVVIQLEGGSDGINTVVPRRDEGYAKSRRKLRLPADRLHRLTDQVALHPAMRAAAELVEDGRLAIVQGVGYPNPSRSHAVSMSIWHTARLDRTEHNSYGWIGRALGWAARPAAQPASMQVGDDELALALIGRRSVASTLSSAGSLTIDNQAARQAIEQLAAHDDLAAFVRRTALDAYATADLLQAIVRKDAAAEGYPETQLAGRLQRVGRLIKAELAARVHYVVQPGYDTHAMQLPRHSRLLCELSEALKAFLDDLKRAGLDGRVAVMAFSEFGRRVQENASAGTDHGTAGPVLVAGPAVQPAVHGRTPSLTDLADGDLKHTVDFRSVYATLLEQWLGVPSPPVLNRKFSKLPLFR